MRLPSTLYLVVPIFVSIFGAVTLAVFLASHQRIVSPSPSKLAPWCINGSAPAEPGMYGDLEGVDLIGPRGQFGEYIDIPSSPSAVGPLFRQGLAHLYGFNNFEARRNFETAKALAPNCALCHWGVAMSLAPNINYDIEDQNALNEAARSAHALSLQQPTLLLKSRQLIASVMALVAETTAVDGPSSPGRKGFANVTCAGLLDRHDDQHYDDGIDPDLAAFCASGLMAMSPWDYYEGRPQGGSYPLKPQLLHAKSVLEHVLWGSNQSFNMHSNQSFNPHSLSLHLYIHLMEPSNAPLSYRWHAAKVAQELYTLKTVWAQGHLTHMPAHLFMRIGRFIDGVNTSMRSVANGQKYLEKCLVPYAFGHNLKMLTASARLAGMSEVALRSAREEVLPSAGPQRGPTGKLICPDCAGIGHPDEVLTLVRFGRWQDVLAVPLPPNSTTATWMASYHYARSLAHYAQDAMAPGDAEAAVALKFAQAAHKVNETSVSDVVLPSEIAAARAWRVNPRKPVAAIEALQAAAEAIDAMRYAEPPRWYYSPRQCLGYVLLNAPVGQGRDVARALANFQRDLQQFPENGWALLGAAQAYGALGNSSGSTEFYARFATAWRHADTTLSSPCPQLLL